MDQIRRILALWPSQAADDGDELVRGYLLATEDYPACDVEAAVDMLVKGIAPGVNPSFRPKPSELGSESHRQNHVRCDREARDKRLRPALPPPDIEHTPESRARMKAILEAGLAKLHEATAPEDKAAAERSKAQLDKVNAMFQPDMSEAAMRKRLGFSVGDPEDAADAA